MGRHTAPPKKASKSNPFTPIRRFFFKLEFLTPAATTEKHLRSIKNQRTTGAHLAPSITDNTQRRPLEAPSPANTIPEPSRLALQKDDPSLDAIVITTLNTFPFCCHEDLVTMPRTKLVEVAQLLNAKLPSSLQIEVDDGRSDGYIRSCIEILVGLRPEVPGAPKAIKQQQRMDAMSVDEVTRSQLDLQKTPPSSPLTAKFSSRSRKRPAELNQVSVLGTPRGLDKLDEEDEGDADDEMHEIRRPVKRRRLATSTRESQAVQAETNSDVDMISSHPAVPLSAPLPRKSLISTRVLRSHSLKRTFGGLDTTFVNTKPRYRRSVSDNASKARMSKVGHGLVELSHTDPLGTRPFPAAARDPISMRSLSTSTGSTSSKRSFGDPIDDDMASTSTPKGKRARVDSGSHHQMVGKMGNMHVWGSDGLHMDE